MNLKDRIAQALDMATVAEIREMLLTLMGEATSTLDSIRTSTVSGQIQAIVRLRAGAPFGALPLAARDLEALLLQRLVP